MTKQSERRPNPSQEELDFLAEKEDEDRRLAAFHRSERKFRIVFHLLVCVILCVAFYFGGIASATFCLAAAAYMKATE